MSTMHDVPSLLDLPEDVIYEILRFLDATSLYLLAKTCSQLDEIIRSHIILWRRIDARRRPNDRDKLAYCLDRCYAATHTLLIRGDTQSERLAPTFLPRLASFSRLAILACENQILDGTKYNVTVFPAQLREFSLKQTIVTKSLEFFKGSGDHFGQLRVLNLDQCDWLSSAAFMPISKYPNLEILSVYRCHNVENSIAYLTLSGQGFKSLKIFDARLSPLGNTLIRAIHRTKSLLAIYLQNEDLSYKVDYMRRRLQILRGAPIRDFLPNDDEFDIDDRVSDENNFFDEDGHCDDDGLIDYLSAQSDVKNTKLPQGVLYLDPYGACTCGYDTQMPPKRQQHNLDGPPDDDDDDDQDDNDDDDGSQAKRLARYVDIFSDFVHQRPSFGRGLYNNRISATAQVAVQYQFYDRYYNETARNNLEMGQLLAEEGIDNNGNGDENRKSVIKLYIFNRGLEDASSDDDAAEPPAKKMRIEEAIDEALAGPSGLLNASDSDSPDEEMGAPRPPTPHPGVEVEPNPNPNGRGGAYRVFFRDSPVVHIENINHTHKDVKVPLRRLSLRGYKKVTNNALRYIGDLDLDLLDVTYTSVTAEGVRGYLISHPLCRVMHEKFCTCLPNLHF